MYTQAANRKNFHSFNTEHEEEQQLQALADVGEGMQPFVSFLCACHDPYFPPVAVLQGNVSHSFLVNCPTRQGPPLKKSEGLVRKTEEAPSRPRKSPIIDDDEDEDEGFEHAGTGKQAGSIPSAIVDTLEDRYEVAVPVSAHSLDVEPKQEKKRSCALLSAAHRSKEGEKHKMQRGQRRVLEWSAVGDFGTETFQQTATRQRYYGGGCFQ